MADVAVEAVGFVPVDFAAVVEFVGVFGRVVEVVEFPLAHGVIDVAVSYTHLRRPAPILPI